MKTVLITGCSSGFGLETAHYFLERDWRVIATMRTPQADLFPALSNLRVLALDVTDPASIERCLADAGPIDVLVNNAGIGLLGAVEGVTMQNARDIFETNTLGTIAMTQAVVPQFRERKAGTIVNVTSTVTVRALPLLAIYTASKAAVNAFTESVALELAQFNIHVKLVLPGRAPQTQFGANAQSRMAGAIPEAYAPMAERIFAEWGESTLVTAPGAVPAAVWQAATDPSTPMRTPAGDDAVVWFNA